MAEDMTQPFGFGVAGPDTRPDRYADPDYNFDRPQDLPHENWGVWLPHQCDEWLVVDEASREAALAELDRFIAEATAARQRLAEVEPAS